LTTIEPTLVDTGVLLRAFDANFSDYASIRRGFRKSLEHGSCLVVAVQNLAEFWNVATRPFDKNGHGLSIERVKRRLAIVEQLCKVVCEDNVSYEGWKRTVSELGVSGVAVHNARLVAVMLRFRINQIVTLNPKDFHRYAREGIRALEPNELLGLMM
jgi:predicted nucleic acid-binding protein